MNERLRVFQNWKGPSSTNLLINLSIYSGDMTYELSLVSNKSIGGYVRTKKNQNQVVASGSWSHYSL